LEPVCKKGYRGIEIKLLHEVLLVTKGRRLVLGVHMYAG
jgi:hypothetical protein